MTLSLDPHPVFQGRSGPVLVVVADGVGIAPDAEHNAVTQASTPTLDALLASDLSTQLAAHGTAVGLPTDDDMGNSEVGHNAIGAGRIFAQGAKLVNKALESGSIFGTDVWGEAISHGRSGTLHFIGLHSDGNVHSHINHLHQLIERAVSDGVTRIRLHLLLDGRDTPPRSALKYIQQTEMTIAELNESHDVDIRIGSGGGRMTITMDRYEADWDMVQQGYNCHAHGIGRPFSSANEAIETLYSESDDGDQYLEPFTITDMEGESVGTISDGDAVILFNFRGDRAIEISQAFEDAEFDKFDRGNAPNVFFAGMLQYDGDLLVPKQYLVDPPVIDRTMGEYLSDSGIRSFAVSETQKFGHVTYFWNGNKSGYINDALEKYIEIPSDNVAFDEAPAMKAQEITDATIALLRSGEYRYGRINFANGDMVGHTGNLSAAIAAMETVDHCVQQLIDVIQELDGVLIYTSDHGNADQMFTESDTGERIPMTSHTLAPVPFVIHDPQNRETYDLVPSDDAGLSHIASTTLNLLGFEAPSDYNPSLIRFH
ncbi:MAG: 2,3-bisphosphoglycerate-independent phosphoglycerate mutase [Actinomycetota bacterium]|nr:phosphoglycerate mutase (2,3-diphosphoglycerate-independent) [Acidimicrobiaceae bacterium]MEC7152510.1 2,3-bisphosphoglycerate-independent phosphoglycerate mutase [Actinomycetota bacterium]MEC7578769.1 2,3-bisphosphoglycerate-independent phosphoglycerate mutase [Actinomycetota bacterium]MEC7607576.1 2,3-bisphosphoglycerate-independent phosphoglycerate mutase [Actinomycetota bacterium]MEC8120099.1 2,3-bisphosphoglycerate-independent phosphoglycerate mutase [Actinomycetota bacterium]|tara:strand:+ start:2685 stop:4310 length:1626 start_codon:yes stop_codon:yes gene_type:complete